MTIEEKMVKLETSVRRYKLLSIAMLVFLLYVFIQGVVIPGHRIVTSRLVIEDDEGMPRFEVSYGYPWVTYMSSTPSSTKPLVVWIKDYNEGTRAMIESKAITFSNDRTSAVSIFPAAMEEDDDIQHRESAADAKPAE